MGNNRTDDADPLRFQLRHFELRASDLQLTACTSLQTGTECDDINYHIETFKLRSPDFGNAYRLICDVAHTMFRRELGEAICAIPAEFVGSTPPDPHVEYPAVKILKTVLSKDRAAVRFEFRLNKDDPMPHGWSVIVTDKDIKDVKGSTINFIANHGPVSRLHELCCGILQRHFDLLAQRVEQARQVGAE